jgi:hypothetical protein
LFHYPASFVPIYFIICVPGILRTRHTAEPAFRCLSILLNWPTQDQAFLIPIITLFHYPTSFVPIYFIICISSILRTQHTPEPAFRCLSILLNRPTPDQVFLIPEITLFHYPTSFVPIYFIICVPGILWTRHTPKLAFKCLSILLNQPTLDQAFLIPIITLFHYPASFVPIYFIICVPGIFQTWHTLEPAFRCLSILLNWPTPDQAFLIPVITLFHYPAFFVT